VAVLSHSLPAGFRLRFVVESAYSAGSSLEQIMTNIFVERKKDGTYVATQNKRTIASGDTQAEAGAKAHAKKPDDPILAERVRDTDVGGRDKWRRFYPPSK
jgi:hypothetical protein